MPMKKSDFIYKTIQLILFILLAITCLCIVLFDANMRSLIASDPGIRLIYALLGGILGLSFIFVKKIIRSWTMQFTPIPFQVSPTVLAVII